MTEVKRLDVDFAKEDWPQQWMSKMRQRLVELGKEPFVTETRVGAAYSRISTSAAEGIHPTDGVHPDLIKAIMEDERFIKYRKMLELEGAI